MSTPDDEPPSTDPALGYDYVGPLWLPRILAERLRAEAAARGLVPLALAREWLAERLMAEPDP